MGLLLLLTSMLLSSWIVVDAQRGFTIGDVAMSIEPSTNVTRGINVTLRCSVVVSSTGHDTLIREYTIYKDSQKVYTKNISTSDDLLYHLTEAKVFDSGGYKCKINIKGKEETSKSTKLTVTGLSKPVLTLDKKMVNEGEMVTARCEAPGEKGSIFFYLYKDGDEIIQHQSTFNQFEYKFHLRNTGRHSVHCQYTVVAVPESFKSEQSNPVIVSVTELPIKPVLNISPQSKIYEGDQLNILCTVINLHSSVGEPVFLYLSHGTQLWTGTTIINHTIVANNSGNFECKLEKGAVSKSDTKNISVTELFSAPTLTMPPNEVFQKANVKLTCKSEYIASERLNGEELVYTLDQYNLQATSQGVFDVKVMNDANYSCVAQAKGIMKWSNTLTIRPKVIVSKPEISVTAVDNTVVLGQNFKIRCESHSGSLPISYTLYKDYMEVNTTSVEELPRYAVFTVTITKPDEIKKFMCGATNQKDVADKLGPNLRARVVEPVQNATLTVVPSLPDISEGSHLNLICGVSGTPPVTFNWYHKASTKPLFTTTSMKNHSNYEIPSFSKEQSGTYYCNAINRANHVIHSNEVYIEAHLALWKKAIFGGIGLLVVAGLIVAFVVYRKYKTVRVVRTAVSVWSERPPHGADDEESSVESSEPDVEYTEVVHPQPVDTARVPLRIGTDTVYSELKDPPPGAAVPPDYGSVVYADLNGERPDISHYPPDVNSYQDLPEPVD